ncbi:Disease resistance protein TAO1 [Linum perenne]
MHRSAYAKVKDLIDTSLFTCSSSHEGEKIEVHDLLKEMAWNVVNKEPKLGKRSRLVDPDDIHDVLTTQEALDGYRTTEGICLDLSQAKVMYLEANVFEGMNSLTYLKFWYPDLLYVSPIKKKLHLSYGSLNSLPNELRWLHWDEYPSKYLPSNFYPQHLVYLTIRRSPIRKCWQGKDQPQLVNLMLLDLSYCRNLIVIPDLSKSLKLEELVLMNCISLVELPSHVQYLTKLITLDLRDCKSLKHIPPKLDSMLLKRVWMSNCPKVTHCPDINSGELVDLDLDRTPVRELSSAIYSVKEGGFVRLYGQYITNISAISASLLQFHVRNTAIRAMDIDDDDYHQISSKLKFLRFHMLELYGNSQLQRLPNSIWNMVSNALTIQGSPLLKSLPEILEPVKGLTNISITECESLESIPSGINNIKSLKSLYLRKTNIKSLPCSIQELGHLERLDLKYCESLESIPGNIHKLASLTRLYLKGCRCIRSLPEFPPNVKECDISGCRSLQALPSNTPKLLHLQTLKFVDCPQLDQTLPDEIVANFPVHAAMSLSRERSLTCWRSELPKWFAFRSMKNMKEKEVCTVKVELPLPKGSHKLMMEGIAFGILCSWDLSDVRVKMRCDCEIDSIPVASWSSSYQSLDGCGSSSDCLLMWFDKKLSGRSSKERKVEEAWYVKYAGLTVSFRFYLGDRAPKSIKIKSCGVSLIMDH